MKGTNSMTQSQPLQTFWAHAVLVAFLTLHAAASASAGEMAPPAVEAVSGKDSDRWSSFLPFVAEEATKRGYELPLPFGVSAIYNYIQRDIEVHDLRLGRDGNPPQSASRFVNLGSDSRVNVGLTRVDAWLLPFVNVYGLFGYVHNQSTTRGAVTLPALGGPRTFDFAAETTLGGFVGGGGLTLAAGYREFFIMADANYTQTDMGFDDSFRALVASARTGWNGKIGTVPTRLWLGVMYWDTENTASATVDVPGEGPLHFEADQGPAHPWNASVGGSVVLSRHWEWFAEYGFNFDDVHMVATGLTLRFEHSSGILRLPEVDLANQLPKALRIRWEIRRPSLAGRVQGIGDFGCFINHPFGSISESMKSAPLRQPAASGSALGDVRTPRGRIGSS